MFVISELSLDADFEKDILSRGRHQAIQQSSTGNEALTASRAALILAASFAPDLQPELRLTGPVSPDALSAVGFDGKHFSDWRRRHEESGGQVRRPRIELVESAVVVDFR